MPPQEIVAHPLFYKYFRNVRSKILARFLNSFFSLGGIHYYLFNEHYSTRILLYNYLSLLANKEFPVEWEIVLYSSQGERIFKRQGRFSKEELVVIDLGEIKPSSPYGIVVCHLRPVHSRLALFKFYETVFFTEHYHRSEVYHDVAHSLRYPLPFNYGNKTIGEAFFFLPQATPYLIIGNAFRSPMPLHRMQPCEPKISLVNCRRESKFFALPAIPSLGCLKVNLAELFPGIYKYFDGRPGLIRLQGANVMRKPFFYQSDGAFIASDHL